MTSHPTDHTPERVPHAGRTTAVMWLPWALAGLAAAVAGVALIVPLATPSPSTDAAHIALQHEVAALQARVRELESAATSQRNSIVQPPTISGSASSAREDTDNPAFEEAVADAVAVQLAQLKTKGTNKFLAKEQNTIQKRIRVLAEDGYQAEALEAAEDVLLTEADEVYQLKLDAAAGDVDKATAMQRYEALRAETDRQLVELVGEDGRLHLRGQ